MTKRSRYQMINRGRKDRPRWYVEDHSYAPPRAVYNSRYRSHAEGYMSLLRQEERRVNKLLAQGYHLPGLTER